MLEFCCCSSVSQSCPTLCNTTNCSTPGFPVLHHLLEFPQTHVYWVGDAIQPPHPLSLPFFQHSVFPSIRVFPNESALHIRWLNWMSSTIQFCVFWCRCGWQPLRHKPNGSWSLPLRFCMTPWCWGEVGMFSPLTLSGASIPCSQPSVFSAVSIVPGGTGSNSLSSLWNHVNSLYHSSHIRKPSWEHQLLLWCTWNCIEFLFVTAPSFLSLLHVTECLWISPQLLPFRSCFPSSGSSLIHPSAFLTVPSAAFTQRLGIPFEAFVMEINKEL